MDIFEWTEEIPVTANNLNEMQNILNDNVSPVKDDTIKLQGEVLYSNTSGTNGNITLSKDVANYDYIEIMFRDNDNRRYSTGKIWNNKSNFGTTLIACAVAGTTTSYLKVKSISVSGTSITNSNYNEIGLANGSTVINNNYNYVYILKVIGYEE